MRPSAESIASPPEPATERGGNQPSPDEEDVGVAAACELGAAQLGQPLGLPDDQVYSSKKAFDAVRQRIAAPAENDLAGVGVADSRLDPSGRVAVRRNRVQERQPGVVDRTGGLDQLFSPGYRLKGLDRSAEPPHIGGDGGGDIK